MASLETEIDAVVFDLGGVLIDWDPRYVYRPLFEDPADMEEGLAFPGLA
jgi:2-haloacid dehalogenase